MINGIGKAEINGPFRKIGIVFQPMGLNNFVKGDLNNVANHGINIDFSYFGSLFEEISNEIFATDCVDSKVEILDNFFLSHINANENRRISEIISWLHSEPVEISVADITEKFQINRKTLLRMFNKHLLCSPKDYSALIKFRRAIDLFYSTDKRRRLTDIALDSGYYDQSSFIKHFKSKTGFNPKAFFKNITPQGEHSTFWILD